jgi:hypothetical protein
MVVGLMAGVANAAVLISDNFNAYTLGNLVPQDAWTAHSGAGSKPVQVIPSPPCFCPVGGEAGNAIELVQGAGSGEDVNKPIGQTMESGQTWYAGFCVVVDGTDPLTADDYIAHFKTSGTYYGGKAFVAPFTDKDYTFGFQAAGSGDDAAVTWPSGFEYGTCHRIIVEYGYDTGYGRMWVDPDCDLGPDGNLYIDDTGYTGDAFEAFAFRQASDVTCTQKVDNLLVADTWADVCCECVPEPATLALMTLGALVILRRRR